jgi:hypothetical protein
MGSKMVDLYILAVKDATLFFSFLKIHGTVFMYKIKESETVFLLSALVGTVFVTLSL